QGTISVRVKNDRFILKENDLILMNRNEIHSTSKTEEDNIILALQINLEHISSYYPKIGKMVFDCKSFLHNDDDQERFDTLRHFLAQIGWEISKKREGYQLTIGSIVYSLIAHLVKKFDSKTVELESVVSTDKDIDRIQNIV